MIPIKFYGGPYDGYEVDARVAREQFGRAVSMPICVAVGWCLLCHLPLDLPCEAYDLHGVAVYYRDTEGHYRLLLQRLPFAHEVYEMNELVSDVINQEVDREAREQL